MSFKTLDFLSLQIPQTGGLIPGAGQNSISIRRESYCQDVAAMSFKTLDFLSRSNPTNGRSYPWSRSEPDSRPGKTLPP